MKEVTTEDFYNRVQGFLYDNEASAELIIRANPKCYNDVTKKIEELWEDGEDAESIAIELVETFNK
ncbi:hypothetical protein CL621_00060 [archaeon]|jgi:hypothetical protein|nr:hypothetical protein [archaeon]|tara:strand:+ start:194 stop:391 length:198 start_codon:yes stop_codon:yes gene_type:complete